MPTAGIRRAAPPAPSTSPCPARSGSTPTRLTWPAGDVVARTATLENRGNGALGAIALAVDVTRSSALDRDARAGLRIRVDRCSTAWMAGAGTRSLLCAGRVTEIVDWRPLAATRSPWPLGSLPARASEWLRVSLQLPANATTDLAGRRTTIQYRFTAQ